MPFLNWCAFVLRTAVEHAGEDASAFFSHNGWEKMQRALAIRHRITHPKSPEDLEIADDEMDTVRDAHVWLLNCTVKTASAYSVPDEPVTESAPPDRAT